MRLRVGLWGSFVLAILLAAAVAQQQNTKPRQAKPKTGAGTSTKKEQPAPDDQKAKSGSQSDENNAGGSDSSIDESQYVGTDACKDCHEEVGGNFAKNPHAKTLTNKRLDRQGCESCHGPGRSHSDAGDPANIVSFGLLPRAEATKVCATCHQFSSGQPGASLHMQHAKANAGCLDCHNVHSAKVEEHLLKSETTKLCSTCHVKR